MPPRGAPNSIAVMYVEWTGAAAGHHRPADGDQRPRGAERVAHCWRRACYGSTAVGGRRCVPHPVRQQRPESDRQVIDVSGDGPTNQILRRGAILPREGINVNGLPIPADYRP
jgi:hypothetical protein